MTQLENSFGTFMWKYWPDEEGAVTSIISDTSLSFLLWKYWPDEEGAVTSTSFGSGVGVVGGNTGLMKKVL